MTGLLDTPSFSRTSRLSRMRSQRVVHVVQTEKNNNDVSVVTVSEDGYTEQAQETVDFGTLCNEGSEEPAFVKDIDNKPTRQPLYDSIFFGVNFSDGAVQHLTRCEAESDQETARSHRGSLFSDDEFEPIRMRLPKRAPLPLRLEDHKDEQYPDDALPSPEGPPPSIASDNSSHSSSADGTSLDDVPTVYTQGFAPNTAASSSTLFSVASTSSSSTCVNYANYPKSGGRTFCAFEEDGGPAKLIDIVTPSSVTGTRGLVDLRLHGYDFNWSRFAGRSEAAHGLSPEDSAELEMFLSRGPKSYSIRSSSKSNVKKSSFEKKFREIFKLVK